MTERTMVVYCGFTGGEPHIDTVNDGFGGKNMRRTPAIFMLRREALLQYEDVRAVTITWSER